MAYFSDLSACTYFGSDKANKLVAVGWLDREHQYPRGQVSEIFLDKLTDLLVQPWAPSHFLGLEECPYCGYEYDSMYKGKFLEIGSINLFVPGEGFLYVMPSLAAHYILAHGYAPPQEFCDAVLRCPPMGSPEYFQAIVANGPQRYADLVKAKYLANS